MFRPVGLLFGIAIAAAAFVMAPPAGMPALAQGAQGGPDRLLPRDDIPPPPVERGDDGDGATDPAPFEQKPGGAGEQGGGLAGGAAPKPASPLDLVMKDGIPEHGAKRAVLRDDLYALLATAPSEKEAKKIASQLQRVWSTTGSDTVSVLLSRAAQALKVKDNGLALELLDTVVELAPDQAEMWNRRAYVHYQMNNYRAAVGDLRRALALDPSHFKALDGLGTIFQQMGDDAKALRVFEQLQAVHPYWPGLDKALTTLKQKVEGRGI